MANNLFREMWNILKENDFQIDLAIKSKFACTSCKNIMIKPCNVPCGCRYCYDCLKIYLNYEEKVCLGDSDYCKRILINIDINVSIDHAVNMEISKIAVKCPMEFCDFRGELGKMTEHMRSCDRQPVRCPYHTIGCDQNNIVADKLKEHFIEKNLCHASLLMDFVDNWRNKMKLLKTNVLDLQEENRYIKEQMESKQESILALEKNVAKFLDENRSLKELETQKDDQNKQIKEILLAMQMKSKEQNEEIEKNKEKWNEMEINQEQMRSRMERITQDNMSLREELEILKFDNKTKEKMISVPQTNSEDEEQEIGKMKENYEFLEEDQEPMKRGIEKLFIKNKSLKGELRTVKQEMTKQETILSFQMRLEELEQETKRNTEKKEDWKQKIDEKCDQMGKKQKEMATRIDIMTQENSSTTTKSEQRESAMKALENKLTQIQVNQNYFEFLWCIKSWEETKERARNKIVTKIISDHFYSHKNGYKMNLILFPDGSCFGWSGYFSLFLYILQGEFDNILKWPFRHDVKLELLNQETGLPHVSRILSPCVDQAADHWKKPCSESNGGFGFSSFIKLSELTSNAGLCQGNQIWIRATVQLKP